MTAPALEQPVVTKAMCLVKNVDDSADPNGEFDLILSAPTLDRDGEVLDTKALEPLPDHISMDVDHGMSVLTTAGSGTPSYDDDGMLRVRGTYSSTPLGQTVRTLVKEGHVRTASVAFIPRETAMKSNAGRQRKHITKGELLNGAFTPVPCNTDAVILSSKGVHAADVLLKQAAAQTKEGRRNSSDDAEMLQTAHDALVATGAVCTSTASKSFRHAAGIKSIIGSVEALQDRVSDALEDAYGGKYGYWGWLRGVLPNATHDGGTVIFQSSKLGDPETYDSCTYSQDYTDDGQVVTLTGTATEVDIHEVVAPDADADRDTKSLDRPTGMAASSDPADIDLQLRAASIRANAALTT